MIRSSLVNIQNDLKKNDTKGFIALSYITIQSKQKIKNTQKYNLWKTSKGDLFVITNCKHHTQKYDVVMTQVVKI